MKRLLIATLIVFAMAPAARADEASKRAKVEQLVVVMRVDHLSAQMLATMKKQLEKMSESGPGSASLTPAQKKAMTDFEDASLKLVGDAVSWPSMKADFIDLYAKTFTESEIDGMIAFYKSPAGQAVLDKMPELTSASMKLVQARMVTLQPQLQALQDKFIEQMSGTTATPPAPTPAPAAGAKPKN